MCDHGETFNRGTLGSSTSAQTTLFQESRLSPIEIKAFPVPCQLAAMTQKNIAEDAGEQIISPQHMPIRHCEPRWGVIFGLWGPRIVVIDDISKDIRQYLVNMKIQSISKVEVICLAANFTEPEDRQRVLRIVYEEFRREYSSNLK